MTTEAKRLSKILDSTTTAWGIEAAAELRRLAAENAALRKDAERLNYLEAHTKGDVTICAPGTHGGPVDKWLVTFDDAYDRYGAISREHQGDTLRAAIDAAMKGKT